MNRNQMRNRIKAITNGFREKVEAVSSPEEEQAKRIADLLKATGAGNVQWANLLSEITGLNINKHLKAVVNYGPKYLKNLVCVVAESGVAGSIPLNIPLVLVNDIYPIGPNGVNVQSHLQNLANGKYTTEKEVRLATDEEINRLTDAQLDYMIEQYTA